MKAFRKFYNLLLAVIFIQLVLFPIAVYSDTSITPIEIQLDDIELKPGNGLKLKALALKSNPSLAIDDASLLAVEVLAKSRQGAGKMRLRVGNNYTQWTTVGGTKDTYDMDTADSFTTVKYRSPKNGKKKVWQLFINGYIKIRKIVLYTVASSSIEGGSI
jgi:hypothetical protein